jgi:ArsR family transcriptional regulator, arsenate/arsenite/antimonite-responsive transcriptional repressor
LNTATVVSPRPRASKPAPPPANALAVPDGTIQRLTNVFNMLADRSRLKILLALGRDGELHVTALCELLGQSQPAVSHHLTLLRMNGLVSYRRDGKHNYYHLD